ncbi:uncharacterized protein LOC100991901 isoform X2 [Pan paniscus]|uniref:uncharacterized protein LOC100991901 isoform X2 n=1 Tax=Pan paniscus TaxID=9597 RepID=UPI002436F64A|nr:uncharacterized protein LOC100991901 isoform X2 [Pan paniscus]
MGIHFSCIRGDSKKPSKKRVKRKPYSTTMVISLSPINEILRRYSLYTNQHQRHHGFWRKKKIQPQEDSEESLVHKDRGGGERPVDVRVVRVAPLRLGFAPCGYAVQDISKEDTVYDICNEDAVDISDEDTVDISNEASVHDISNEAAVCDISNDAVNISNEAAVRDISNDAVDICNEAAVHDISNEDTIEDISYEDTVYDITNEDAVRYICKKEDATKEPLTLENDLIVESMSDDEDFAARSLDRIDWAPRPQVEMGSHCVAQDGLELLVSMILLPQPPKALKLQM